MKASDMTIQVTVKVDDAVLAVLEDLERRVKALEASEYKREVGTFWANNRDRILAAAEERTNAGDDSPLIVTGDDDAN